MVLPVAVVVVDSVTSTSLWVRLGCQSMARVCPAMAATRTPAREMLVNFRIHCLRMLLTGCFSGILGVAAAIAVAIPGTFVIMAGMVIPVIIGAGASIHIGAVEHDSQQRGLGAPQHLHRVVHHLAGVSPLWTTSTLPSQCRVMFSASATLVRGSVATRM